MSVFVLVHGAGFGRSCWDLLTPMLDRPFLAVDLPGRGSRPADLAGVRRRDCVDAVVEEIMAKDLHDVILVGHSMAGITLPGVAEHVPQRLARIVFVSCVVPADGGCAVDTFDPGIQEMMRRSRTVAPGTPDPETARAMFCRNMDEEQTNRTLAGMVPEAIEIHFEPVYLRGLTGPFSKTWIRLLQDEVFPPARQDVMAARTGADVIDLDAAHLAMISQPRALADVLNRL
jgi:pimeloyl-ACP methyl ester carboxylesterase